MQSTYRTRKETLGMNKENLGLPIPKLNFSVQENESSLLNTRLRKHSDTSDNRMSLQASATDLLNSFRRRRIHSASDTNAAKTFANTRFAIYNEEKSSNTEMTTGNGKSTNSRSTDTARPFTSIYQEKSVPGIRIVKKQREDDGKSSDRTSDPKKSPENPLIIPKSDIFKIKEKHQIKAAEQKKPKTDYDLPLLKCTFNIEYMTEYIGYQVEMMENKKLSSSFLKKGICVEQRKLIMKFLIESATHYEAPSYILYQAVSIFDSYIDKVNVDPHELQITALAALWIALKKDWVIDQLPEARSIMKRAPKNLRSDRNLLLACEKKILKALQFELGFADPFSMLALFLIMVKEFRDSEPSMIQATYYCGSYLIDLFMFEKELYDVSAFHLARICAEIALVVIMTSNKNAANPLWDYWWRRILESNPILVKHILPERKRKEVRNLLLHNIVLSKDEKTDYHAVYKKYCTKRYGEISVALTSKVGLFFRSKINDPK